VTEISVTKPRWAPRTQEKPVGAQDNDRRTLSQHIHNNTGVRISPTGALRMMAEKIKSKAKHKTEMLA